MTERKDEDQPKDQPEDQPNEQQVATSKPASPKNRPPEASPEHGARPARRVERVEVETHEVFKGPIPPPAALEAYEKVHPGLANRIMQMAEKEADHSHKMDERSLSSQVWSHRIDQLLQFVGQLFGLLLGLCAIGAGLYAAMNGHPVAGTFFGVGGVATLAGIFVYGSRVKSS